MKKKRKEYRAKQNEIDQKIKQLNFANEGCYLASEYLINLALKTEELFISSERYEKRALINLTLQNLRLKKKIVLYEWTNHFDKIANYATPQTLLSLTDLLRNYKMKIN